MMSKGITTVLSILAIMWAVFILDVLLPLEFTNLGLVPRRLESLPGVVAMPFLHANFAHIIGNTVPLLVLGSLVAIFYSPIATRVFGTVIFLGGALLWLLGRPAAHVGASGLIYGLAAFLVAGGFYYRNLVSVLIALAVGALYGFSLFVGLLPTDAAISWEGHLFGAIAGVAAAAWSRNAIRDEGRKRDASRST
ncbi:MAG: rhomboid family intramembrane serine protease [Ignavibacteriales bacterium]|nr:rhomboid family intramembrane serine protease [Ignavibacteriales bacterium]